MYPKCLILSVVRPTKSLSINTLTIELFAYCHPSEMMRLKWLMLLTTPSEFCRWDIQLPDVEWLPDNVVIDHAIADRDSDEGVIHPRGSLKRAAELLKDLVDGGKTSQQHSLGSHCTHEGAICCHQWRNAGSIWVRSLSSLNVFLLYYNFRSAILRRNNLTIPGCW